MRNALAKLWALRAREARRQSAWGRGRWRREKAGLGRGVQRDGNGRAGEQECTGIQIDVHM